jgi:transglutaminase-like putative cysteine protease
MTTILCIDYCNWTFTLAYHYYLSISYQHGVETSIFKKERMMSKKVMLFICVILLCLSSSSWAGSASGRIVMEFDLSAQPQGQEAKLWIPYPVSSQYQDISDIDINGDYAESAVYADKKFRNPILYARWDKDAKSRKLSFSFTAVRQEVVRRDFPVEESAWSPVDYQRWLLPTSLGPVDGPVKTLADKITAGKTTVRERAKAIYDWICENMYRDPDTIGCGKGNVCDLLQKPGGKCTDIHSVFVALCRAAGIPAREIFGIRLGKKDGQDISKWQHCWAEFFLPGYGWVPVDPADVRKMMLKQNLKPGDAKTLEYRRYFWGAWDACRVQLAMGRDLILTPPQAAGPLNTFGYPYAEMDGKPLDFYQPKTFGYKIIYHQL